MHRNFLNRPLCGLAALLISASMLVAQTDTESSPAGSPAAADGAADGATGAFSGYVPSARSNGMVSGGSGVNPQGAGPANDTRADGLPALVTGRETSLERQEGFNESINQVFPMTPEMLSRYRDIYDQSQRAMLERPEPQGRMETGLVSLEPGEDAPVLTLSPGIASIVGFYDATGAPWPISQYILGDGNDFQVIQLGGQENNLSVTPLVPVGWTNLIVVLEQEDKPVVLRLNISPQNADFRRDIQVMRIGPNADVNTASTMSPGGQARTMTELRQAGGSLLVSALSGVDMPENSREVRVTGVTARAWLAGDQLIIRSNHALLSPSWDSSMSGPDGTRVYTMKPTGTVLFSVSGQIIRADIDLP